MIDGDGGRREGAEAPNPAADARTPDGWVRPARIALVITVVVVLAIVVWPSRPADGAQTALQAWFERAHAAGLPRWISFDLVEFLSNVLMFVPLGLLGILARPPGGLTTVLLGSAFLSTAVELMQQTVLPHRTGDLRDVVANVLGAVIGALVALFLLRRVALRRTTRRG